MGNGWPFKNHSKGYGFLTIIVLVLIFSSFALALERNDQKIYGSVKPDQALVYFIWQPDQYTFQRYVHANDQLLVCISPNSYAFTYINPGQYLIWFNKDGIVEGSTVEFVPGQTYYITTGDNLSILTEAEGIEALKQIKYYAQVEGFNLKKGTKKNQAYSKAKEKEALKTKATIEPSTAPLAPSNQDVLIKIPIYTPIRLELSENISSSSNLVGETVRLTILEDVVLANQVCFQKGTPVTGVVNSVEKAMGMGESGTIDLIIPKITSVDQSSVPTIGQVLYSGMSTSMGKSFGVQFGFGLIGLAAMKGNEAFLPLGREVIVWTRFETWVDPSKKLPLVEVTPPPADAALKLSGSTGSLTPTSLFKKMDDIEIKIASNQALQGLELYSVNNKLIPQTVKPKAIKSNKNDSICTFGGWDIGRYLIPGQNPNSLKFRGSLVGGGLVEVEVDVPIEKRK